MTKLTGGLEYCKAHKCTNTIHYEDAPKFYPFCPKHKKMNKSWLKYKEEPYCFRCGADKKQVCRDSSRLSCSAWGTYYGRHLWTDAKRQPKANDDAFLPAPTKTDKQTGV